MKGTVFQRTGAKQVRQALRMNPWQGLAGLSAQASLVHNGPSPIWVPELQGFIGLGHWPMLGRILKLSLP